MPKVEFPYVPFQIPPSDPFPNGQVAKRPVALAEIRLPGSAAGFRCIVCLDSGADYCVFPAMFAMPLGIDLLKLKKNLTGGVGSSANPTYYTDLQINLGRGIQFKSYVGFTPAMDALGMGLLGQSGFFENYDVHFHLKDSKFVIDTV